MTVGEIQQRMSALELTQWLIWLDEERLGPAYDELRHARLLAATCNGERFAKPDRTAFDPMDFMPRPAWQVEETPRDPTFEEIAAQASAMFTRTQ